MVENNVKNRKINETPNKSLKVAMKLLTFFDDYRLKSTKYGKIEKSC